MSNIQLFNECNLQVMARYPDGYFDLAIVDPPYGIMDIGMKITKPTRPNSYKTAPKHAPKQWDTKPPAGYWKELFRVSKNQIIWGGNYFTDFLPVSGCWIFWDKINGDGSHFADGEFAWTSFKKSSKKYICSAHDGLKGGKDRIHPTQKPLALYKWMLKVFASPDMKIIDTHAGSFTSTLACHDYGVKEFVGCEIDTEYFEKGTARFEQHKRQLNLFAA
jgi:site-specific DNA-methyltransferase (adenine-specific)